MNAMQIITPDDFAEWRAAPVQLFLGENFVWNVIAPTDAALVRLQVRYYGVDFLAEFRCAIGSISGQWLPLARFTFPWLDLTDYADVDVELFPAVATPLFAGLAKCWGRAECSPLSLEITCAPIEYFGALPVYYPLPGDLSDTILPAHAEATPTAAW